MFFQPTLYFPNRAYVLFFYLTVFFVEYHLLLCEMFGTLHVVCLSVCLAGRTIPHLSMADPPYTLIGQPVSFSSLQY